RPLALNLAPEDLRRLLFSTDRIEQVRAIQLLTEDGSATAHQILLDAFLESKDPVLLALLEEAMLKTPPACVQAVMDRVLNGRDPELLTRLTGLLSGFVERRPELAHELAGPLVASLAQADLFPDRAGAATAALVALGVAAVDPLGEYL